MTPKSWVLSSDTRSAVLDDVDHILKRMWAANLHVPPPVRLQIGIAAGEIAANIVEHAAADRPVSIRMEARVGPTTVRVDFTDNGAPTLVDIGRVHLPPEMAESGRGLAMARAVLQRLSYVRNGLNHWTLESLPF